MDEDNWGGHMDETTDHYPGYKKLDPPCNTFQIQTLRSVSILHDVKQMNHELFTLGTGF